MKRFLILHAVPMACLVSELRAAPVADPLDRWHQLNPDADLYDLVEAHFHDGRWVAMTESPGYILNSPGTNWTRANFNAPAQHRMWSLHFGGSRWIAVAGETTPWQTRKTVFCGTLCPGVRFPLVSYGNNRWVAFQGPSQNEPPQTFWSTDGLAWKRSTSIFDLGALVFGGGQWLALGTSGFVSSSSDGDTGLPGTCRKR